MKIVANEKLIRRNATLGQIASISSLVILIGSFVLSFQRPDLFVIAYGGLLLGFVLTQMGIYYGSRWGRSPRPDELINQALKGMDDRYALYHYILPAAHVLIGPAGVWVFLPKQQVGKVTYEKNRWRIKGGGFIQGYLRIFGQEGIGRPDLEVASEVEAAQKYFKKKLPDDELPEIQPALVFTHPKVEIEADAAPVPTLYASQLKEFIRKTAKGKTLPPETVKMLQKTVDNS